jgi:hypothetical protein
MNDKPAAAQNRDASHPDIRQNSFSPRAERRILTEGYQPEGGDDVPLTVPPLVSGICYPQPRSAPMFVGEPPATPPTDKR